MKLQLLTNRMQLVVAPEPSQLLEALNTMRNQIEECPKECQQRLKNMALSISIDIDRYKLMHKEGTDKISSIKSEKPASKASKKHYDQLEKSLDTQKQHVEDKSAVNQDIKATEYERFRVLQGNGLPMAKNAAEFHELKARDQLLLDEKEPALIQKKPMWLKKVFLSLGKISAGLATALGIDHMINPEHYQMITLGSFSIGLGFSVLMLALTQGSAYRIKEAQFKNKNPKKHYIILVGVTIIYMVAETFINYEGVIQMAKDFALESSNSGLLQEAGQQIIDSDPTYYSLLIFTVALVAFVALYSALIGRDQAIQDMEDYKFRIQLAKLRQDSELMKKASQIDESEFLEKRLRPKARRRPDQAPVTKWYQRAVKMLTQAEKSLEESTLKINQELATEGAKIQQKINELGNQIDQSQQGRGDGPPKPIQLIKLAE